MKSSSAKVRMPGNSGRIAGTLAAFSLAALVVACGSGGSSSASNGSTNTIAGPAANVATATVDSGPNCPANESAYCSPGKPIGTGNVAFVTVTICVPGTSTCQTIDHVMIDTGSSGLRLLNDALNSTMLSQLPAQTISIPSPAGTYPMLECAQFADGYTWGSVRKADVHIGSDPSAGMESATSINVEVIGDSEPATSNCATTGTDLDFVGVFGANGLLGVGLAINDCFTGKSCPSASGYYYACPSPYSASTCVAAATPIDGSQQVSNPVASFTTDNNGVILEMPSLTPTGASTATGSLVFGVNTQSNNATGSQSVFEPNLHTGTIYATYTSISGGYTNVQASYWNSFLDSGSNGFFLPGTTIACSTPSSPQQGDWFNPLSPVTLGAGLQSESTTDPTVSTPTAQGAQIGVSFQIADWQTLDTAANDLGAPESTCVSTSVGGVGSGTSTSNTGGIDFGLPFFYGRNVFVIVEQAPVTVSGTPYTGPFWAF